ncbi:MAG: DUF3473 domain-containing protein [Epsilonproteobacteria bacterium]|nr:DUF3473 domain-containing protein [Campylobacterota bacterium]
MIYLPESYRESPHFWLTIDVERIEDANFGVEVRGELPIDYREILEWWIDLCGELEIRSCAFVLGSFAERYPEIVKELARHGHEIACHGWSHELVYTLPFHRWRSELERAKVFLEELTGRRVEGYRSPSWSLPFEKRYYEALVQMGFRYSSSYFPFKTYMYGNEIEKRTPFSISTPSGPITELPIPKKMIPFSGGFYMRILPLWVILPLAKALMKEGVKPIIYTHPYELESPLFTRFLKSVRMDLAYILTFAHTGDGRKRLSKLLRSLKEWNG